MPEFIKFEVKTLAMVGGILGNVFLMGWMARSYDARIAALELEAKGAAVERKEAKVEREEIKHKLEPILVIQNDIQTIKSAIVEIKKAVR